MGKGSLESTTYFINDSPMLTDVSHKDLGLHVTSNLSWSSHIQKIVNQAYGLLGLLRRTFKNVNSVVQKKNLYISLVRSSLMYCSEVWRPHKIQLEHVQMQATKYILNAVTEQDFCN